MSDLLAVDARNLTKSYGKHRGIEDITLTVEPGEVVGLVGTNGAGKSTFIRTLLDFIRPTSGSLTVFGKSTVHDSVAVRRRCTYLPGEFVIPARLTGRQTLHRYSFARRGLDQADVDRLADRLSIDLNRPVGDLSKGNRQKVALVLAFAPQADLIILDEPTSGLDPVLQRVFSELVVAAKERGSSVLLSSHVMGEVEHIADRVALLRDGRLAVMADVAQLLAQSRRRATVRPADMADVPAIVHGLATLDGVTGVRSHLETITFAQRGSADPLLKLLAHFNINSFELAHADLEDAFFASDNGAARNGASA